MRVSIAAAHRYMLESDTPDTEVAAARRVLDWIRYTVWFDEVE